MTPRKQAIYGIYKESSMVKKADIDWASVLSNPQNTAAIGAGLGGLYGLSQGDPMKALGYGALGGLGGYYLPQMFAPEPGMGDYARYAGGKAVDFMSHPIDNTGSAI